MKIVFLIGAKLFGLYLLYLSLFLREVGFVSTLTMFSNQANRIPALMSYYSLSACISIFHLVFGFILLFKADLFYKQTATDVDGKDIPFRPKQLIQAGGILMGIAIIVSKIGPLLKDSLIIFFRDYFYQTPKMTPFLINEYLSLLFAFILVLWSKQLTRLIKTGEQ